jgi:hypothetical protein
VNVNLTLRTSFFFKRLNPSALVAKLTNIANAITSVADVNMRLRPQNPLELDQRWAIQLIGIAVVIASVFAGVLLICIREKDKLRRKSLENAKVNPL